MRIKELRKDRSQQNRLFLIEGESGNLIVVEAKAKSSGWGFDVVGASESYASNQYFDDITKISGYERNEQGAVFSLFDHSGLESETFQRKTTNLSQKVKDAISDAIDEIRGIDQAVEFDPQEQLLGRNIRSDRVPDMTGHQREGFLSRAGQRIRRAGRRGRAEVTAFAEQGTGPGGEYTAQDLIRAAFRMDPESAEKALSAQYKTRQNVPELAEHERRPRNAWGDDQAATAEDERPKKNPQEVADALRIMMKLHRDSRKSRAFKMKAEQRQDLNAQVESVLGENRQAAQKAVADLKEKRREIEKLLRDHYNGRSLASPRGTSASKINTRVEEALALFDYLASEQVAREPRRSEMNYIYKKPAFDALSGRYKLQSFSHPVVNQEAVERDRATMFNRLHQSGFSMTDQATFLAAAEQGRSKLGWADMTFAGPVQEPRAHMDRRGMEFADEEQEVRASSLFLPHSVEEKGTAQSASTNRRRQGALRRQDDLITPHDRQTATRTAVPTRRGLSTGYTPSFDATTRSRQNLFSQAPVSVAPVPRPRARTTSHLRRKVPPPRPSAASKSAMVKLPSYLALHIQAMKEAEIKDAFFDLDDTLIKHVIKDYPFMQKIFGHDVDRKGFTDAQNYRSYANKSRQEFYFYQNLRGMVADRVTDPDLVSNYFKALDEAGIRVHINTLNSSTLAKVLCEEHGWPVSSISAADGQIIGRDKVAEAIDSENGVSKHLNTEVKTGGSPRKIVATESVLDHFGGSFDKTAFFDDDFSRKGRSVVFHKDGTVTPGAQGSSTLAELEERGTHVLMQSQEIGVRFDSKHPEFKGEIEAKTAELKQRTASRQRQPGQRMAPGAARKTIDFSQGRGGRADT